MAEDSKEKESSQQESSEAEKKPVTPAPIPPRPAVSPPATAPARQAAPPPRPAPPAPAPAPRAQPPKDSGRRTFIKGIFAVGAILSMVPFVPWGSFLTSSVTLGSGKRTLMQKVVIDDLAKYGPAAGQFVNVNDLSTFPPNSSWVITYPSSGVISLDAQNPDTFQKYELIRLPEALGGASKNATDFVAFSKVCVHLWCSPNYNPTQTLNPSEAGYEAPGADVTTHQQYECPCHGSIYEVPDGKATFGPASLQPAPTNAIPMLTLQADADGNLYAYYPNYDPETKKAVSNGIQADGELGFGRDFNSYQNFIKPKAQLTADLNDLTTEVG